MDTRIEIHYTRWDGLPTYAGGSLTRATVAGQTGLPVVCLSGEQYRSDDGSVAGALLSPAECPPLTLVAPLSASEVPLVADALAQGYTLDPRGEWSAGALKKIAAGQHEEPRHD